MMPMPDAGNEGYLSALVLQSTHFQKFLSALASSRGYSVNNGTYVVSSASMSTSYRTFRLPTHLCGMLSKRSLIDFVDVDIDFWHRHPARGRLNYPHANQEFGDFDDASV
jgi:hypothetical protein